MKDCTKCRIAKLASEYFVKDKTGRLHSQCKLCYKEHRKSYYKQHYATYHEQYLARAKQRRAGQRLEYRQNMIAYMADKSCVTCGESDIRVLEFDHLDPSLKTFNVSQAVAKGYSWNDVLQEIKKCQLLCANCHKRKTAQQFNWYKAK